MLHPKVRQEVQAAVEHINAKILGKGSRLRLAYTLRTVQEQEQLYAQGRTVLFDKAGKRLGIVTNCKGGQSIHNYGLAFDIVLLTDVDGDGNFETAVWDTKKDLDKDGRADWMEVVEYFKALGWTWGGDWASFRDYPHFEKTYGFTWKMLLSYFKLGKTFTEVIDGKKYTWVNI